MLRLLATVVATVLAVLFAPLSASGALTPILDAVPASPASHSDQARFEVGPHATVGPAQDPGTVLQGMKKAGNDLRPGTARDTPDADLPNELRTPLGGSWLLALRDASANEPRVPPATDAPQRAPPHTTSA